MNDKSIVIRLSAQRLELHEGGNVVAMYSVSTALNGAGEQPSSECTPRGRHVIAEKIGAHAPPGAVFIARQPTGEVWSPELAAANPDRDWILTRILWLDGCEDANAESKQRFIYIHGTPDTEPMGLPRSHGCVRMRNDDVAELFDLVEVGTTVDIHES
ncbi:MAG TPA: L,D-transpeptidase [Gammaproteobacteria bacterium]